MTIPEGMVADVGGAGFRIGRDPNHRGKVGLQAAAEVIYRHPGSDRYIFGDTATTAGVWGIPKTWPWGGFVDYANEQWAALQRLLWADFKFRLPAEPTPQALQALFHQVEPMGRRSR